MASCSPNNGFRNLYSNLQKYKRKQALDKQQNEIPFTKITTKLILKIVASKPF